MESKKKKFQEKDKMIHMQKGGVGAFIFCW